MVRNTCGVVKYFGDVPYFAAVWSFISIRMFGDQFPANSSPVFLKEIVIFPANYLFSESLSIACHCASVTLSPALPGFILSFSQDKTPSFCSLASLSLPGCCFSSHSSLWPPTAYGENGGKGKAT